MIANCRWRTWWIASTVKIASTDPAAPSRWPIAPWGKSSRWHKIGHEGNRGNLVAATSGELPSSRIMQDHRMLHDHQRRFWWHSPPQRRLIVVQIQIKVSILFMVTPYSHNPKYNPHTDQTEVFWSQCIQPNVFGRWLWVLTKRSWCSMRIYIINFICTKTWLEKGTELYQKLC